MKLYIIGHQIDGEKKNTHEFCGSQKFMRSSLDAFPHFSYIGRVLTVSQRRPRRSIPVLVILS